MNKYLVIFALLCFSSWCGFAQEENKEIDSLQNNLKKDGIVIDKSSIKKKKSFNPLAPSKAAFYSALLPGLGQIYNKKYWKVPLVYGAIGAGIYTYKLNDNQYNQLRVAFKRRKAGFLDDQFYNPGGTGTNYSLTVLESQQENYQESRDLALVITIVLYVLNIVDANVDAHLQQFNVDDDLSVDFKPYFDLDPITSNPNYGMGLTINF
ncbi:DUF5683 domain-containing protein [Maribacter sp.]|uniref:DUF5683 domain-containing protein n=1 Tax=Maribacter sp. TaxID=1897614 RepID=UPI0025B7FE36|nr:DUF5683 domain-containing protein [Maribacter sp.]